MSDLDMSRLAQEIARDIYPLADILRQYQIEPIFFQEKILTNPRFKLLYVEAHTLWNSASNAQERSALKSAVLFEEWLAEANRLYHDTQQPMSSKVEMMKLLARVAKIDGSDKTQQGVAPGERVVVNINLSAAGQREPIVIDKTATIDAVPQQVTG